MSIITVLHVDNDLLPILCLCTFITFIPAVATLQQLHTQNFHATFIPFDVVFSATTISDATQGELTHFSISSVLFAPPCVFSAVVNMKIFSTVDFEPKGNQEISQTHRCTTLLSTGILGERQKAAVCCFPFKNITCFISNPSFSLGCRSTRSFIAIIGNRFTCFNAGGIMC